MPLTDEQRTAGSRWVGFSVLIGFTPIAFAWIMDAIADANAKPLARGDLFAIAATMCFASVGELFGVSSEDAVTKIRVGVAALILGLPSAVMYAATAATGHPHEGFVIWVSLLMWISSAVASTTCVIYARR